jgi:hypothetical protein
LPVIERVVERLGCVGDLPQVRGLRCKGVGLAPHLRDVVRLRITARVPLRADVNVAVFICDRRGRGAIREWGWTIPILVDESGGVIAGHARLLAAKRLDLADVPVMVASGWSDAQKRAYVLAEPAPAPGTAYL